MQFIKHLILSALALNMLSCGFLEDKTKDNEATAATVQDTTAQNAPKDGYIVTPYVAHPQFKALSAAFETQEHRFEIDRCAFKYNGKSFFIGDTEEKILKILGKPDEIIKNDINKNYHLEYIKFKIILKFNSKSKLLESLVMLFTYYSKSINTTYKIIKFRKTPYKLDMTLNEFIELCDLNHEKNLTHDISSFYIKNEKPCSIETETSIGSTPNYHSISGGHVTMRGEFNPNSTGPINILGVGLKTNN